MRKTGSAKRVIHAVAFLGIAAVALGCAESSESARSTEVIPAPITGVDQLLTNGDYLNKIRALQATQRKMVFILVRAKVEKNLQMVAEANALASASARDRTNVIKLVAVQAAALRMVADAADWPEMAEIYSESSEIAQALVRGELSREKFGSAARSIDIRTEEELGAFIAAEGDATAAEGMDDFVERFAAHLIATTKAMAWDIDTSQL
ncbi:hypothetical protein ACW7GZ_12475 [Luteimonas sp. A537]